MKKVLLVILPLVIVALAFFLFSGILEPQRFSKHVAEREAAVVAKLKDIRSAEQAFKQTYGVYTGSFDELIDFVLNDSMTFVRSMGSADDSASLASGEFFQQKVRIPVIDTIFSPRKPSREEVMKLQFIPYSETEEKPDGERFILGAGEVTTESGVVVPVFEARAPYNFYLRGLNEQLITNVVDDANTYKNYPGLKVGDLATATNDALNRE